LNVYVTVRVPDATNVTTLVLSFADGRTGDSSSPAKERATGGIDGAPGRFSGRL
jgi:hypothetical protein